MANVVVEATGAAISSSTLLGYLSEQQSTNLVLQSENFGTTWAAVGTPTRVAANTRCGAVVLDLIGDDDAGVLEGYTQTITFTGNAVKARSLYFAQGTSTSSVFRIRDTTAGADRLLGAITWSGGVPTVTMTTGTLLGVDTLGNSCFRARVLTTSVTAANTNSLQCYPATDAALSVTNTGNINWGGEQAEDNATQCTSYIGTTIATVTRNRDNLTDPAAGNIADAQGTAYAEVTLLGAPSGNGRIVANNATTGGPLLMAGSGGSLGQPRVYDGTTFATSGLGQVTAGTPAKVAATWSGATMKAYLNGTAGGAQAFDGTITNAAANISIGSDGQDGDAFSGCIRNVKIWTSALTDAQVAAL